MEDKEAAQWVTEIWDHVITFALQQLSTQYNRDDYKELLELSSGTQRHFTARIGWHCDLWDQDVAFQRAVSHSKTLEHTEDISTMLITKGVESSTSCVTFCDNNLREVGLLVQWNLNERSSILEENPYLFHRQGNLTGQPAFSLHLCDDSVTVDNKQRMHGLQHAQQFDEPPTRFPSVYNVMIHL
jgi:hypothetical protein